MTVATLALRVMKMAFLIPLEAIQCCKLIMARMCNMCDMYVQQYISVSFSPRIISL